MITTTAISGDAATAAAAAATIALTSNLPVDKNQTIGEN
jgi:hypothetical protein